MNPVSIVFALIAAYLIGSFPTGFLATKMLRGIDIREHGSGNPGATNVFRVVGKGPGLAVFFLDFLKGLLPVLAALHFGRGEVMAASWIGLATIVGHNWTCFLKFKGGKGVATSGGVFMALLPVPTLISLGVFAVVFFFSRRVSVGSMTSALSLPVSAWLTHRSQYLTGLSFACALLILAMHKQNIVRLANGQEPKVTF